MSSKKILILGGGVGGVAVASRLRRLDEDYELTIIERADEIALSPCGLPFYIGGAMDPKSLFTRSVEEIRSRDRIHVLTGHDAIRIDRSARQMVARDLRTMEITAPEFDKLVLSPGAAPIRPHIPGIDLPSVKTVRTLADAEGILEQLDRCREATEPVAILGGGLIGLEIAETLHHRGIGVTVIEAARQVLLGADLEMVAPIHEELRHRGVELRLGISLSAIVQDSEGRVRLQTFDGEEIAARLVIVAAGVQPEVSLALDAGLQVGLTGAIKVNDRMQTNDPDIYAIGDVAQQEVRWPERTLVGRPAQTGSALRQARIVADHIFGFRHHAFESFGGSMAVNIFGVTLAGTGFSEKRLKRERIPFERAYVVASDRADFHPEAESIMLKLLFSPGDGRILGAQAVGRFGVERRIDVLATAIRFGGSVRQLSGVELCYAPPVGRARDLVHLAGNVATNVLDGLVRHATFKGDEKTGAGPNDFGCPKPGRVRRRRNSRCRVAAAGRASATPRRIGRRCRIPCLFPIRQTRVPGVPNPFAGRVDGQKLPRWTDGFSTTREVEGFAEITKVGGLSPKGRVVVLDD